MLDELMEETEETLGKMGTELKKKKERREENVEEDLKSKMVKRTSLGKGVAPTT
jgi:hypothetical protein